jgi:hypothetical protein
MTSPFYLPETIEKERTQANGRNCSPANYMCNNQHEGVVRKTELNGRRARLPVFLRQRNSRYPPIFPAAA